MKNRGSSLVSAKVYGLVLWDLRRWIARRRSGIEQWEEGVFEAGFVS